MKKTCHIVGAGDFSSELLEIEKGDTVIACDGGLDHLIGNGIAVDYCIGDFDSLGRIPEGDYKLTVLPREKDVTDTHAACNMALDMGFENIKLYGMLGGERFSRSLANIQLACGLCRKGVKVEIIDGKCRIIPIKDGKITFDKDVFATVSLFAFGGEAVCSCRGLKYEIESRLLTPYFALGVSNELLGKGGEIEILSGLGVAVIEKKA